MSDTEFTSGPWEYSEGADGEYRIYAPCFPGASRAVFDVADVWLPDRGDRAANGYLIAAGPEMFAALRMAAQTFRKYEKLHRDKGTPEGTTKANSNMIIAQVCERALAKAAPSMCPRSADGAANSGTGAQ